MSVKVDIVVERQWHAPSLAHALMEDDMLGTLFTGFPRHRYTRLGVPPRHIRAHPLPALWNFGVSTLKLPNTLKLDEPSSLARFVAGMHNLSSVVTCLATSYQNLFPKLLDRPIVRVIECGSMHPEDHFLFQQRARKEAGLSHTLELPAAVVAEGNASKLAHFLVCGSRMVVDSYVKRGYLSERVLYCPYGVDTGRFRFAQRDQPQGRPVRIATVGVIGIRKGIVRLLRIAEWAKSSGIHLEFHLIGPVEQEAEALLQNSPVIFHQLGVLKGEALVHALHQADAYCLPSYEEGFPISQLEAMATGLPAITSNDTGGREAVSDGVDGIVLADFTREEFETKLAPWLRSPQQLMAAGTAASTKARLNYSLENYTSHVASCYGKAARLSARIARGEKTAPAFTLS